MNNKVIYRFKNNFGLFSVEELSYEGRFARVLFSLPNRAAQSGLALDNNPRLLFDYNQRILELSQELKPSKVLILGGGVLTLATAILNRITKLKIDVVEQNPDLIDIASKYFNFKPDDRIKIIIDDAKNYINQTRTKYDLVIVDIYNDFEIPAFFKSLDFSLKLIQRTKSKGLIVTNCISGLNQSNNTQLMMISSSYRQARLNFRVVKADNNYPDWLIQNLLIVASRRNQLDNYLKGSIEVNPSLG